MDRLFAAGALDVFYTPIHMKKNRPGVKVTVLVPPGCQESVTAVFFQESTTLGVRFTRKERTCLDRGELQVETAWGPVRVKVARYQGEIVNAAPEYEDCRRIAAREGIPLKEVYRSVLARTGEGGAG